MSKEVSLQDRVKVEVDQNGLDFTMSLYTNNGTLYSRLKGLHTGTETDHESHTALDGYDLQLHTRSHAKKKRTLTFTNCEVLEGQTCRFEPSFINVERPVQAIDQGLRLLEHQFPSFFRSVHIPSGEVVD